MEEIAAGKGRKPKPFMLQGGKVEADAVWDSKHGPRCRRAQGGDAAERRSRRHASTSADLPDFIAPQLCETLGASAVGRRLGA